MCGCWGRGGGGGGDCTCSITGSDGVEVTPTGKPGGYTIKGKPSELISKDSPNALVIGGDGKLFVKPGAVDCAAVVACVTGAADMFTCGLVADAQARTLGVRLAPDGGITCDPKTGLKLFLDPAAGNLLTTTTKGAAVTCASIVTCVGQNLGQGLDITGGKIVVKRDPATGNALTVGPNGLLVKPTDLISTDTPNLITTGGDGKLKVGCTDVVACVTGTAGLFGCGFAIDAQTKTISLRTDPNGGLTCKPDAGVGIQLDTTVAQILKVGPNGASVTCPDVMWCVLNNLETDGGLEGGKNAKLQVKIDAAAGNLLKKGTGGLAVACTDVVDCFGNNGIDTTDTGLPRLEFDPVTHKLKIKRAETTGPVSLFRTTGGTGGTEGGALLRAAPASPQALDYALTNGINVVIGSVIGTTDNDPAWVPWRISYVEPWHSTGSTTPTPQDKVSTANWKAWTSRAGDLAQPRPGESAFKPDGGWYGYREKSYNGLLLGDVYERLRSGASNVLVAEVGDARAVDAVMNLLATGPLPYRAMTIVACETRDLVERAAAKDRDIELAMIVHVGEEDIKTPTAAIQAGASWALLDYQVSNDAFLAFKAAGLTVMSYGGSRQVHFDRLQSLGIKHHVSHDPIYFSRQESLYRRLQDTWDTKRPLPGELTAWTDHGLHVHSKEPGAYPWDVRGCYDWSPGRLLTQGFVDAEPARVSLLAGWMCPLPNPTNYLISATFSHDHPLEDDDDRIGLWFGCDDDGFDRETGYIATYAPSNGRLFLRSLGDGGTSIDGPGLRAPAIGEQVIIQVTVDPKTVRIQQFYAGGAASAPLVLADATKRGPYVAIVLENVATATSVRAHSLALYPPMPTTSADGLPVGVPPKSDRPVVVRQVAPAVPTSTRGHRANPPLTRYQQVAERPVN
ncbi:hypothetical protein ACFC1T_08710 [Kitasatospora sp. NPDC056076]|uniref:hypothetical protein n=1 Tax=Kitasatospora sp. NPDC056076 TaxID=3345703 RepID=UPI0035D9C628